MAGSLTLVGVAGVVVGLYGLLDGTSPVLLGLPTLLLGAGCAAAALVVGARRDPRTHYRRDPWAGPEWLVAACGAVPAAVLVVAASRGWDGLTPVQVPASLPVVPPVLVLAIAAGALASVAAPVPPLRARTNAAPATRQPQEVVTP